MSSEPDKNVRWPNALTDAQPDMAMGADRVKHL